LHGDCRSSDDVEMTPRVVSFGHSSLGSDVAEGRVLFHTATDPAMSGGANISCATCHPDGQSDGWVWTAPAGLRTTPALGGGIAGTAPFHWSGDVADIHAFNDHTVRTVQGGSGLSDEHLHALFAYLDTLHAAPPPSPHRTDSALAHGRELFESDALGCTHCHA